MFRKSWIIVLIVLGALLLTGSLAAAESAVDSSSDVTTLNSPTILTVTSGQDPDDSMSHTLDNNPDGLRTLRRAIVQARNTAGPVEIHFDIPKTAAEGYDSTLDIWKIQIFNTTRTTIFRQLTGDITIDGSTQPGGRNNGPKIFIVGPGGGMKDGLTLGETALQNNNVVLGLGFQNLRTHIFVNSKNNIIEDCWFGLDDRGTGVILRNNSPQQGTGSSGITLQSNAENNTIRDNVFAGFHGTAATLRGNGNTFRDNYVGTRADGTVVNSGCTPEHWLGGGGVVVQGRNQTITNNIIAGLRQEIFHMSQQPDALRVTVESSTPSDGHTIEDNRIGLDINDTEVGTCGRGIYLSGNMRGTLIANNTIVDTGMSAISLNGTLYNDCTLRSNVIKKSKDWPEVDGNPEPEDAIQLGPMLPSAFLNFMPAKVTAINGTTVTGTSGDGSPAPNCEIELFLDDNSSPIQAQQSLAVVTADANGDWEATIPASLSSGQGIRTTTTTAQFGTIPNMHAGTTTGLSELYLGEAPPSPPGDGALTVSLGVERINASTLGLTAVSSGSDNVEYRFDVRVMDSGESYSTIRDYSSNPNFTWSGASNGVIYEIVVHADAPDADYSAYYVVFGNTDASQIFPFTGLGLNISSVGNEVRIQAIPVGGTNVIYALVYKQAGGEYTPLDPSNPYQASPNFVRVLPHGNYEIVVHAIEMAAGRMTYIGAWQAHTHN